MQRLRFASLLYTAVALGSNSFASTVWVVAPSPGPGVDGTDLQTVIDAAAAGDIVVVRQGVYAPLSPVVIDAKALMLIADAAAAPTLVQALYVQNLAPGQNVLIRGLDLQNPSSVPSLWLRNDKGQVWIDRCDVLPVAALGAPGLRIDRCDAVLVQQCELRGQPSAGPNLGRGIDALLSTVHVRNSLCLGGSGLLGAAGAPGVSLSASTLSAVGSALTGGNGGAGLPAPNCTDGGAGGPGALLSSATSLLQLYSCLASGGSGGTAAPACSGGNAGVATQVDAGTVQPFAVPIHDSAINSPVREGQSLVLSFNGVAGERIVLGVSTNSAFVPLPSYAGVLGLGGPMSTFYLGTLPGAALKSFPVQELGAGVEGLSAYGQAVFVSPLGDAYLGPALPAVLLDAAL
jgi:hypothetical protein